jgi:hypothetical protein
VNTAGHRGVAEAAGVPLLEEAIRAVDEKFGKPEALKLGNWLTDVSQAIDPVAYAGARDKAQLIIDRYLGTVMNFVLNRVEGKQYVPNLVGQVARDALKVVHTRAHTAVAVLLGDKPAESGAIGAVVSDAVVLKGYFEFVHPEEEGGEQRIPLAIFQELIKQQFTQYFPHEHVDRPLERLNPTVVYASALDHGPRSNPVEQRAPDLYRYLRDHLDILARSLTELELDWQASVRQSGGTGSLATFEFQSLLARLGHLLHTIEDFFAHSNFVELYATGAWDDLQPKGLEAKDAEILARRLRRFDPTNPESTDSENYVVTGYFDFSDTQVSLAHVADELLGMTWRDPDRRFGDAARTVQNLSYARVEEECYEWLYSVNQLFGDPEKALKDDNNRVAQQYKEIFGEDIETLKKAQTQGAVIESLLSQTNFAKHIPSEIIARLRNVVLLLHKVIAVKNLTMTVYHALDFFIKLFTVPLELFRETLKGATFDFLKESSLYVAKEVLLYDVLLAGKHDRIGSHSLLAKDTGNEWLYKYQRACATAAHYMIVDQFCVYFRAVNSEEPGSAVDWQRFLDQLCVNPLWARHGVSFELTLAGLQEIPRDRTPLKTRLAKAASRYNVSSTTGLPDWARVAAATLGVEDSKEIGELLAAVAKAERTNTAPMSFIVPDQSVRVNALASGRTRLALWCDEIIDRERTHEGHGWEIVKGYRDYGKKVSADAALPLDVTRLTATLARKFADEARSARLAAERHYNALK